MNVSIRLATVGDAVEIANIYATSIRTLCTEDYTDEEIEIIANLFDAESYREAIESCELDIFVAIAEEIIGFASIMVYEWRIGDLFVLPSFTRQGVATRLINAVENYALQEQIFQLSVTASLTAQPFYSACGYEYVGDSVIAEKIDTVEMTKSLTQPDNYRKRKSKTKSKVVTLKDCLNFSTGLLFGKSG